MNLVEARPVVYTAQSKAAFYCRDAVCEFVLRRRAVPLHPFRLFEYFLGDRVDRNTVRIGNNNLVRIADEVWVFGDVSDGVFFEIQFAYDLKKKVRYFSIATRADEIEEIAPDQVSFEAELVRNGKLKEQQLRDIVKRSVEPHVDTW